jgi:aldose 1-epimerase
VSIEVVYTLTRDDAAGHRLRRNDRQIGRLSASRTTPTSTSAGEGSGRVDDHVLQIFCDEYAPADKDMTPDRSSATHVAGKPNDFTKPRRVGDAIPSLWKNHGDNYFARRPVGDKSLVPIAKLTDPKSGRTMLVSTTEPCLAVLHERVARQDKGKRGAVYDQHHALCLECQGYPNGVNAPTWRHPRFAQGQTYRQKNRPRVHGRMTERQRGRCNCSCCENAAASAEG